MNARIRRGGVFMMMAAGLALTGACSSQPPAVATAPSSSTAAASSTTSSAAPSTTAPAVTSSSRAPGKLVPIPMDSSTTTTALAADPETVRRAITNLDPDGVIGAKLDCVVAALITHDVNDVVPGATAVVAAASPGQVPATPDAMKFVQFAQQAAVECAPFTIAVRQSAAGNVVVLEAP